MSEQISKCELCGEPMPPGEQMFKFHGYSGPCPAPMLPRGPSLKEAAAEVLRTVAPILAAFRGDPSNPGPETGGTFTEDQLDAALAAMAALDTSLKPVEPERTGGEGA